FVSGHPILSVSPEQKTENKSDGKASISSLKIEQHQFKYLADAATNQLYPVPVKVRTKDSAGKIDSSAFLLTEKSKTISFKTAQEYAVLNAGGSGFYRVQYEPQLANKLTTKLKDNLSVIERFNLVNDTWASVRA